MENDLQQNRPDTLMSELSNWNRQENKFRELFSENALKDREFLKLKLERYDNLFHKYNSGPKTQDEQAMMTMLRFQRRKMEKVLYPGLIRRLLHRGRAALTALIVRNREANTARQTKADSNLHELPQIRTVNPPSQQDNIRKMPQLRNNQPTQQQRMNRHRKKGRSL
jgi:hypothetical protein